MKASIISNLYRTNLQGQGMTYWLVTEPKPLEIVGKVPER